MSEKVIENLILEYLQMRNVFAWKNNTMGVYDKNRGTYRKNMNKYAINGVADILGVLPNGRMLAIEVKTPSGRVSPKQQKFLDRVNKEGGLAFVARDLEIVVNKLKEHEDDDRTKKLSRRM